MMTQAVYDAVHALAKAVASEPDAARRERLCKEAMALATAELADVRAEAVRRLHEQHETWRAVGAVMGTTGQNAFKVALRAKGHESL